MIRHLRVQILAGALLLGCAEPPSPPFDQPVAGVTRACEPQSAAPFLLNRHVLVSDSEGNLPADRHHGSLPEAFRTIMGGYAEAVRSNPARPPRLLFYFNGGLNSQAQVEQQARRQVPCMLADGYYPVFFVWDTEGLASYWEQVSSVWDGQVDRSLPVRARTPLMVLGNVVSGLGQAPADYFIHGRRFLRALRRKPVCWLVVRDDPDDPDALRACPEQQRVTFVDQVGGRISPEANVVTEPEVDAHQREVGKFVAYSLLWPVRLVSTPLAHGLGEAGWTNMLRRTRTTINRSIEFNLNRDVDGTNRCPNNFRERMTQFPKGTGVFASFFETTLRYHKDWALKRSEWRCLGDHEEPEPPPTAEEQEQDRLIRAALANAQITLIGHSMGAIVINALVERFPDLPYTDIVVMASAASLRDTRRVLNRYFEDCGPRQAAPDVCGKEPPDTRFYALMLHPLNDAREREYGGAVPSGSLLVWIDEMYDVPKTPEDKVFGFWPTAKSARRMFGRAAQEHMLYRVASRPQAAKGSPTNPIEHGQFNEDDTCFWRPSFWGVMGTSWAARYGGALPAQALRRCGERHEAPLLNQVPPAAE
jgi:pimeloyl-ACP methyl ester carboxylesterase